MTEPTIFTPDQGDVVPAAPIVTPAAPSIPPELAELVGVGKKYQTVEAAVAALPHAQTHISTLERELAELREEVAKRKTTQELLDEIKSGIPTGATTPKSELSQDTLVKLVEQVITQKESVKTASQNQNTVVDTFRATFGDQAEAQYNKVAAEAGLSVQALNQLAKTSPLAVIKLAGIGKTVAPTVGKIKSDVNTNAFKAPVEGQDSSFVGKSNSTANLLNAWRKAGEIVKSRNG